MRFQSALPSLAIAAILAPLAKAGVGADVVINELRIDQTGTDNDEYFELRGTPGASLTGYTYVVIGDGTGGSGVVEEAEDLTGLTIPASGYFVAAESTFTLGTADLTTALEFENSDNVTHLLVTGWTGAINDDLDTDDDGVFDVTPWTAIVDSLALPEDFTGEKIYSTTIVGPDGGFNYGHCYRESDGTGSLIHFAGGVFDLAAGPLDTPGAANANYGRMSQQFAGGMGMRIEAGAANAGLLYLTLFSVSGTVPGIPAGPGVTLPLNFDALLSLSLKSAGSPIFSSTVGLLDGSGTSPDQRFVPPSFPVAFIGTTINAAAVGLSIFPTISPVFATNSVALLID